jgi:hypothetical protein
VAGSALRSTHPGSGRHPPNPPQGGDVWVRGVGVKGIAYESLVGIKDVHRRVSVSERTELMCISWELSRVGG